MLIPRMGPPMVALGEALAVLMVVLLLAMVGVGSETGEACPAGEEREADVFKRERGVPSAPKQIAGYVRRGTISGEVAYH